MTFLQEGGKKLQRLKKKLLNLSSMMIICKNYEKYSWAVNSLK